MIRTPTPLPPDEVTIGRLLDAAGYETAAIGKTHDYRPLTDHPTHRARPRSARGPGPARGHPRARRVLVRAAVKLGAAAGRS